MKINELPSTEYLLLRFEFDKDTGTLTWKKYSGWTLNKRQAGKRAGCVTTCDGKKYIKIYLDGKFYYAHRIIFKMFNGYDPERIDHIDGDGLNNNLSNIRDVSHLENYKNVKLRSDNTSGTVGVTWSKQRKRWCAQIRVNNVQIPLGRFVNLEDAIKARQNAEEKYNFHPNHGTVRPL